MLTKVRTVLVHNSHPGNIGSSARAIKNMGLSSLYLVAPKEFPSKKALYMASRAEDIVESAVVVGTLSEALKDCTLVLGASSRRRALQWAEINPRQAAEKVLIELQKPEAKVAILYGCEQNGLSNEELECCHYQIVIESLPSYASLNVSQAVLLISHEIYRASLDLSQIKEFAAETEVYASQQELEGFYEHLNKTLIQIQFIDEKRPGHIMSRLKRLFARAKLNIVEINILRGILTAMQKRV